MKKIIKFLLVLTMIISIPFATVSANGDSYGNYINGVDEFVNQNIKSLNEENQLESLDLNIGSEDGLKKRGYTQASFDEIQFTNFIESFIEKAYERHYYLDDFSSKIVSIEEEENNILIEINTNFNKTLKVNDINELPYVKSVNEEKNKYDRSRSAIDQESFNEFYEEKMSDVESFINKKQPSSGTFRITINDNNVMKLEVRYGLEYLPYSAFLLDDEARMYEAAKLDTINSVDSIKAKKVALEENSQSGTRSSISPYIVSYYDRFAAMAYSNKYALNYNPAYSNMNPNGGDCANFVSQCIYAGGIPTDSTWKPYTISWVNTGYSSAYYGLRDYMVGKGYFKQVTKYQAAGGGFMLFPYSHIVFINKNDTVSMTYNGHNNNEANVSFAGSYFSESNGFRFYF